MNQRTKSRKWAVILFFSALGLVLGYFVTILISVSSKPTPPQWYVRPQPVVTTPDSHSDQFILVTHRQQVIGNIKITYRGVIDDEIVFDIVVMDLDPQYAYIRRIPVARAKNGFQLSSERFRLLSAGERNMQISRVKTRVKTDRE